MLVSWLLRFQRHRFVNCLRKSCHISDFSIHCCSSQTSSAGLSSSRTLRCPQCAPLSKSPGMVSSSWQQVKQSDSISPDQFGTDHQEGSHFIFCLCFYLPFISGTYKPRIRCYDTYQLSLKFERCVDSDSKSADTPTCCMVTMSCRTTCDKFLFSLSLKVVAFDILSDDYSKVRHLEPSWHFNNAVGKFLMYDLCHALSWFDMSVVCKCIPIPWRICGVIWASDQ